MGASICCCDSKGLMKPRGTSRDQKQSLLDADGKSDEYVSDEDNEQSGYLKAEDDDSSDESEGSLQEERKPNEKTYREWMELVFWTFAGSSSHSKKNLYMTLKELECFINIVNLNKNEKESDILNVSSDKILEILEKEDDIKPVVSCNEFCDYFCDININPYCQQIKQFIEKQSNWIFLQNALKIFDVVDIDKSGSIEYNEFTVFCKLIGENDAENIENLWHQIDVDGNGQIVIHELFEWYQKRLITQQRSILDNPEAATPR